MSGRAPCPLTPYMTKTPARSAKTSARALQKGSPSMPESTTRPLPQVDERTLASWPVGSIERAVARRAHQMIISAGAALEDLLAVPEPTPPSTPGTPREFLDLPQGQQITHAAHALTVLTRQDAPTALWDLEANPRWGVQLRGHVHPTIPTSDVDQRAAIARWAEIFGAEVEERVSVTGAVHLTIEDGEFMAVPVEFHTILDRSGGAL